MRQIHRSLLTLLMAGVGATALAGTSSRLVDQPAVAGQAIPQVLRGQELRPLSLASGDFDGDGVPDLAAGFGTAEAGVVIVYRGNVDALYPNSPEARQRRLQGSFIGEPFLPMDRVLVLTAPPDFLFAGDFDADGHADLAAAARDAAAIHLLSGDGAGEFLPERRVGLPAGVVAMTSGDLGRRDGLPDLAVLAGPQALVFQAAEGALSAAPAAVRLSQTATSIAIGDFSADHRRRIALRGEDGRVLLLQSDAPRSWRLVEADAGEEGDSEDAILAPSAQSFSADAAAVLAMRVHPYAPSGDVVLKEDGTLSVYAKASLSTFVVNVTTDLADVAPGNGVCADVNGACSLRAAIQEANALAGADTITFAIPGSGVPAIVLHSLPAVTEAVTFDGTTQAAGRVAITGTSNGTLITLAANGCVVRGMVLNGTASFGLKLQSNDNLVEGNFFGTNADGSALQGNLGVSVIHVQSGTNNRIGGTAAPARNVIAGGSTGIRLDGGTTVIEGNYIGTDVTGTLDLGSAIQGIRVFTALSNTIGGAVPGAGNLVSGNNGDGISVETAGNVVQGNRVGTDVTGSTALPNQGIGIRCYFSGDATVGGTAPGMGNLMAGNGSHGLELQQNAVTNIVVQGNRIGTDLQGAYAIPNQGYGVRIVGASQTLIGGTTAAARNLISGNLLDGIFFTKFLTVYPTGNLIQGNSIGTDATGTVAIPNLGSGVSFEYALGTLVGGASAGEGNVISGNHDYGIRFGGITDASANPNHVRGNLIGTNVFGTGTLGNGKAGAFFVNSTTGYDIGGSGAGEANLIANNAGDGIASASLRRIRFRPNSIHSNGGLAVDRSDDGVTPNAPPGTFVWENFPVLTAASTSASGTAVSGTLTSGYAETFTIHVFANPTCDASGYGEARQYLGATTVAAIAGAATPFSTTLPTPAPAGSYITALAVAPDVSPYFAATSELSFCRQVGGTPAPGSVSLVLYAVAPGSGGDTGSVTLRVAGQGIEPGAGVRLVGAGQSDRVGTGVSISPDGGSLAATFALAGAAQGAWDVVVTNPDTTSATLPGAFQVEAGVAPEVWADILGRGTLVVRGGREQTFFLVFGNRGNTDSPATEFVVTIPWQLEVTFVEDFDGSRPVVTHDVPTTTGGSGESTIRFFVPSLAANSSRALAFRVVTVAADPGEFGQEVEIRVWHLTSEILGALIDIPIDPNIVRTTTVVDDTPDHVAWTVHLSDGTLSGDIQYELTFSDVPFESDPVFVKTVTPTEIQYDFTIAFSEEALQPPGVARTPRIPGFPRGMAGKIKLPPGFAEAVAEKLPELAQFTMAGQVDKAMAEVLNQLGQLPPGDLSRLLQQVDGTETLQAGSPAPSLNNLTPEQSSSMMAAHRSALSKMLCNMARMHPASFAEALGIPVEEVNAKTCEDLEKLLREKPLTCPTNARLSPDCDPPKVRRTRRPLRIVLAIDPNEKAGPGGAGVPHYVTGADTLAYTVTFENLETATASAQEVVVTDQLDASKLEFSTFELGPIAFGTHVVNVPPGLTSFTGDVDLRPGVDLIARVSAGFDPNTGSATWHFFSLDPATGQPTTDPILGFLPPNVNSPEGEGHVSFTIDAKSGLATGTEIHNLASIVFDANPAIVTADWFNTIDVTAPASQVAGLPASSCSAILVTWSGTDAHSGIAEYDVFASQDGGQWFRWIQGTTSTSRTYYGSVGSTYAFHSIARDAAGNEEAPPGGADATTAAGSPSPLVDLLTPASGPAAGATVALTGSGFEAGASVTVSGAPASGETVADPTSMTATFPAIAAGGLYDVVAANASACSDTLQKGWLADFNDVPASHGFHDFVEKIFRRSVTVGCSGGNYCTDNPVTRAQMAVFLIKAKYNLSLVPPAATGSLFADVPVGSFAADWIEQLANEGVTGGCGGGNYCPGNSVTRAQMAVFLLKSKYGALYVPPLAAGVFADVPPGSFAADWIEQLAAEGITGGCGGNNYCPNNPVTRGQMAVFLSKTFGF